MLLGEPGRWSAMLEGDSQSGKATREPGLNQWCCGKLSLRRKNSRCWLPGHGDEVDRMVSQFHLGRFRIMSQRIKLGEIFALLCKRGEPYDSKQQEEYCGP